MTSLMHTQVFYFLFFFLVFPILSFGQKFSVSFPIGSTIYEGDPLPLTVIIEGVSCENTLMKSHQGKVSMVDRCKYIYQCSSPGLDTIEVFVRKGNKLKLVGEQTFVVNKRPTPRANVGGKREGSMEVGEFRAQNGVGCEWFVRGNHWENCVINSFNFILYRGTKAVVDVFNEGNIFISEVKECLKLLLPGDKILITNIRGLIPTGEVNLKTLEFIIQ